MITLGLQVFSPCAFSMSWETALEDGKQRLHAQDLPGAESCFRQAVKLVRRSGASASEVARCLKSLADVLEMEDITQQALPLYMKALHTIERTYGKDNRRTLPILLTLGSIFEQEGEYRKAIKFLAQASNLTGKSFGQESMEYAQCQHRLGVATFKAGFPQRAEQLYNSALSKMMQQKQLPSSDELKELLSDYIYLLSTKPEPVREFPANFQKELLNDQIGSLDRTRAVPLSSWQANLSAQLAEQAVGKTITGQIVSPPNLKRLSPQLPTKDSPRDDLLTWDKVNKQRIEFYERLVAIDIQSLGAHHPSVARDLSGLASFYMQQNQYDKAKPLLIKALAIYRSTYGNKASIVKRTQSLINFIAEEESLQSKDYYLTNQYLAGLPKIPLEAQNIEIAIRLNCLALLCYSHNNLIDASKVYAWAIAATTLCCGNQSTLVASCLTDYSQILRLTGNAKEADRLEDSAHNILRQAIKKQALQTMP